MIDQSKKTIIPFFMAGYPDMQSCELLISAVIEEGVNIVEIGVPFSDPLADGPTIQRASTKSLNNGTTLDSVLELVFRLKKKHPTTSIIIFTYLNPLLKFGLQRYVNQAMRVGVTATLTVDLPPEEAKSYLQMHRDAGLKTVFLASPTTTADRYKMISDSSSGFIYYVSRAGVTGAQGQLSDSLATEILALKKVVTRPIAVGFGISSPDQVFEVAKSADAIVVGSHLLNMIEQSADLNLAKQSLCSFIRSSLDKIQ